MMSNKIKSIINNFEDFYTNNFIQKSRHKDNFFFKLENNMFFNMAFTLNGKIEPEHSNRIKFQVENIDEVYEILQNFNSKLNLKDIILTEYKNEISKFELDKSFFLILYL